MTTTPMRSDGVVPSQCDVTTAADADGGLRLSLYGELTTTSLDLRDVVLAALHSEPPRVELVLAGLSRIDSAGAAFLVACGRMAKILGIEYRLTRPPPDVAVELGLSGHVAPD